VCHSSRSRYWIHLIPPEPLSSHGNHSPGSKRIVIRIFVDLLASLIERDSVPSPLEFLRRLGVDAIDLYQIHWPIPEQQIEEGWSTFAELRDQGLVRHIGVSNFSIDQLERIRQIAPAETLQPPYSLVAREAERDVLPYAEREGVGVIVYSPMGSGMLTGKMTRERIEQLTDDDWRKRDERFREPRLSRNLELVDRLTAVAERYDTAPGAVAIAWTLRNPAVLANASASATRRSTSRTSSCASARGRWPTTSTACWARFHCCRSAPTPSCRIRNIR